ncbi:Penicillin-binding protein PbpB [Frondihabitans sp. 762G35]|nr:Penicillin-binding protein PbpB [Frondihabitans sp. 762G35]
MGQRSGPVRSRRVRQTLAMILVFALAGVFTVRLVDIQVVQAEELRLQAVEKRSIPVTLYGTRGDIVDRSGTVLAGSVSRYDLTVAPKIATAYRGALGSATIRTISLDEALAALSKVAGTPAATMKKTILADPTSEFAYLAKGLDVTAYRAAVALGIPWLSSEKQAARTYPNGAVAGNLTGFMGTDGAQAGLEYSYDRCLAGANGKQTYERGEDWVRLPGSTVTEKPAQDGGVLRTTIDADLQFLTQQVLQEQATALRAESATATVSDPKTGEILALADYPSVDPNDVSATKDPGDFGSKALTALYEPGSTMKAAIAAALIDSGKADPLTQAVVPYARTFPWGGRISDAEFHPVENLTLAGILARSSNVGITEMGERLTAQQRFDYQKKFGLFQADPALTFPGLASWPDRTSPKWDQQTNINSMFGQGVSTTALQVAGIYQTLANGGVRVPLHLVTGCEKPDGSVVSKPAVAPVRVVSEKAADETVRMLQSTLLDGGTLAGMEKVSGYNVAAKTGTAEVAEPNGAGYGSQRIISVAGIAPAENPKFVVTVTFTKPQASKFSSAAAPAFHELMSLVLEKYRVAPSTSPENTYPTTW